MNGLRKPVGDQPPAVYWRRRLVVLVLAVAIPLLLWFLISATLASGDESTTTDPATTTSPQAGSGDPNDPSRPCTADDLTLTLAASPAEVPVGSIAAFDLTFEHTGQAPCKLSTAAAGTDVSVRSGEQIYYSTTWCTDAPAFPSSEWVLEPGAKEALQTTWTGQRVDSDCEVIQDQADPGFYWASVAIGGVPAPEVQFQLVEG